MILIFFLEEGYKYVLPIGNTSMLLTTNKYGSVFSRGVVHVHKNNPTILYVPNMK